MNEMPGAANASRGGGRLRPRAWAIGILVTLLAQFGLGMYTNLFIQISDSHPGYGEHNYFAATYHGIVWLETSRYAPVVVATHAGVGLTLVIGSVWLVVRAIQTRSRPTVRWPAVLGALFVIAAAINGAGFLDYNNDVYSYLMAMFFAAAVLCYVVILALPVSGQPAADAPAGHGEVRADFQPKTKSSP
jgi:hypothetical protein